MGLWATSKRGRRVNVVGSEKDPMVCSLQCFCIFATSIQLLLRQNILPIYFIMLTHSVGLKDVVTTKAKVVCLQYRIVFLQQQCFA